MDLKLAQKALDKAKVALMSKPDTTFFTTVLFSLKFSWDMSCPTAMTNGIELRINPVFWMNQPADIHPLILLHEVGHVIFLHCTPRIGKRDPEKWNIAGDFVINGMYADRGWNIPDGWLYDKAFTSLSTEQVYDRLPPNPPPPPMSDISIGGMPPPPGADGQKSPPPPGGGDGQGNQDKQGGMTPEQIETKIQEILIRASLQSKIAGDKPGSVPGMVEIYLDRLLNPKLPWQTILRRFLNDRIKDDYSWRKPNRRFFPDYHLPSMYSEGLSHLAFAVDTSGSVSDSDFQRFISEIHGVMKQFKPARLTLIQFDTCIKSIDTISTVQDLMRVKFHGRGGTHIKEVMDWAEKEKPQALLLFTDGGFRQIPYKMKTPIVWLIHDNPRWQGIFGKTIHYEMKEE